MQINVKGRQQTKIGGKAVTLLVSKNPHEVSAEAGKALIAAGVAEEFKGTKPAAKKSASVNESAAKKSASEAAE